MPAIRPNHISKAKETRAHNFGEGISIIFRMRRPERCFIMKRSDKIYPDGGTHV